MDRYIHMVTRMSAEDFDHHLHSEFGPGLVPAARMHVMKGCYTTAPSAKDFQRSLRWAKAVGVYDRA